MIEIPVLTDSTGLVRPAFTIIVNLGTNFALTFHWNARAETWYFEIATADREPLASGLPVRVGSPIYQFLVSGMPLGLFAAIDTSTSGEDPGREDLGKRVRIYFLGADEL
jgi:hypothetical protein